MKKGILIIIILIIVLIGFFDYRVKIKNFWLDLTKPPLPEAMEYAEQRGTADLSASLEAGEGRRMNNKTPIIDSESPTSSIILLSSFNLNVPFTPQAPYADWNETFKEACEEAAALIVHYYYQNKTFTPQIATSEILKMVDWQEKNWGGHFDLTATQTASLIKNYWGYQEVEVMDNPTIDDIKSQIFQGRPVIVPAAGRELGNPYFRTPGPIYHMLVIKGYTDDKFITNDPGTKRGQDYLYKFETVMHALHDWNEENILQGEKRVIIIYPE